MVAAKRPKIAARAPLPQGAPLPPSRPIPRARFAGGRPALGPMVAAKRPKIAARAPLPQGAPLPPSRPTPRGIFTGGRPALGPMDMARPNRGEGAAPTRSADSKSQIHWWEARPRADGHGEAQSRRGRRSHQHCPSRRGRRSHQAGQFQEADSPVGGPPSGRWTVIVGFRLRLYPTYPSRRARAQSITTSGRIPHASASFSSWMSGLP
jgi:hypothetical protein